jgi:hypothetical protein
MNPTQPSDTSSSIPPELEMLSRIVDGQSPMVREIFQYALIMLMVENDKAEVLDRRVIDAREYLTFKTNAGETFTIVKPDVSPELLEQVREAAREITREDDAGAAVDSAGS